MREFAVWQDVRYVCRVCHVCIGDVKMHGGKTSQQQQNLRVSASCSRSNDVVRVVFSETSKVIVCCCCSARELTSSNDRLSSSTWTCRSWDVDSVASRTFSSS